MTENIYSQPLYRNQYCDLSTHKLFDFSNTCKNTQRFDIVRYQKIDELNDYMLSLFWIPDEISMVQDKMDYEHNADYSEKFKLTEQLIKLTTLDSLQGRSPILTFGQLTTNPEFENAILTWDFFEGSIHSRSYSHIIQSVYPNPQEVFDSTFDNKLLNKHTETIVREYNELYPLVIEYQYKLIKGKEISKAFLYELRKRIALALISVNILEGIRFYSGFATIWSMTEFRNIFNGASKVLQLIAGDETVHLALTQNVIRRLMTHPEEEFTDIFKEITPKIYDMYFEASEEEFEWIEYLMQHGETFGFGVEIGKRYIQYITNVRLRGIGLKPIYGNIKNPISWINKWFSQGGTEGALQEIESTDYKMGGINRTKQVDLKKIIKKVKG